MDVYKKYPDRVTVSENGSYVSQHTVEKDYERRDYKAAMTAAWIFAVVMLAIGIWLGAQNHDRTTLLFTAGGVIGFLLLVKAVCVFLDRLPGEMNETYEMTDRYIKPGSWKEAYNFAFKDAQEVVVTRYYIELKAGTRKPRIYVPEEDMNFVRDYILGRVPATCMIRYE